MTAIIIPTDFSATAHNAALYAVELAKQLQINELVLLNVWQPLTYSSGIDNVLITDSSSLQTQSNAQLQAQANELKALCPLHINITTQSICGTLEHAVKEAIKPYTNPYIVMGITGGNIIEEKLIGSNTISVAQNVPAPVFIIPPHCKYEFISEVMLLSDFKDVENTLPATQLTTVLNTLQPVVHVVNFTGIGNKTLEESITGKYLLDKILQPYNLTYKFSERTDFETAVNDIATKKEVQLIINIAKKLSWFESIFNKSYTNTLAFHTQIPLLVMHK